MFYIMMLILPVFHKAGKKKLHYFLFMRRSISLDDAKTSFINCIS